jgi:hypothetical protein
MVRMIRWTVYVACVGEMINAYETFIKIPEWKRPLGRFKKIILKLIIKN